MRRVLVAVAVMVWLGASTVVAPPPGSAQTQSDCPDGSVCAWPEKNFRGLRHQIADSNNGSCIDVDPDFKSIKNKTTDQVVHIYPDDECSDPPGAHFIKPGPGEEKSDLEGAALIIKKK
jgi:hypothetical protein